LGTSYAKNDAADRAPNGQEAFDLHDDAQRFRLAGLVVLPIAGAITIAGLSWTLVETLRRR
jgi:hypothetical protein